MVAIKKWPKLSGEKVEILKRLFVAGESMNLDNFVEFFTDDAVYQFSNFPVVYGPQGIRAASLAFLQKVEGLHHHIENVWEMEDGSAVCELQTTYVRHDGAVFTLPCSDIIRFKDDKIQELLIYMDISPVYNTPEARKERITEGRAGTELSERVRQLFAAAYANDLDTYLTFFTEDALYKAGNAEPIIGPSGIREFAIPVMRAFKTVAHEIKNIWEVGDTVICQAEVVYNRNDGKVAMVPTVNVIRFKSGKIRELKAFGDPSPAFSQQ
jgi:ketosteroid isomerase-like protein